MNQIKGEPNDYDFGLDFDYAVWTANTNITLTNVPWNADYRDVVSFESTNDLNAYIDKNVSQNVSIKNSMYAKVNEPIKLDIPFNVANRFNYVRVYNPAQPISGNDTPKYFYYFIADISYTAPNTTTIIVQLDVFQTYIRQVQFGRCYIERGHIGIANEDNFRNYGADYLTVPEGLDTGDSYTVAQAATEIVMRTPGTFHILVVSTVNLEADPGTVKNPSLKTANGGYIQGLPTGASYYLFTSPTDFNNFLARYRDKPWVTQGIISISIIPSVFRYYKQADLGAKLPIGAYRMPSINIASRAKAVKISNWRNSQVLLNRIPPRYRKLKKFFTFPYMAIELTNFHGQSSIHRPELLNSDNLTINEEVSLSKPDQRISWWIDGYRTGSKSEDTVSATGLGHEHAVNLSNFPSAAIVNNNAILAMANNAHSMAYGFQSADWSQQRALRGNEVSYDQATMGINAASEQAAVANSADVRSTGIGNNLARDQWALNATTGILGGALGGGALGGGGKAGVAGAIVGAGAGVGAAITSGLSTGLQIDANNSQLANRLLTSQMNTAISGALAGGIRDTNKSAADWAARGDYENTIAGLNARTRDMQLTPPSLVGQQGGEVLGMLNQRFGYSVRVLVPDQSSISTVGEYWLRYGYAVQRFGFIPNNLMAMDKFTYWKLKETYIRSAGMPEGFKQAIRGILEKGVTVWANPDDIGMIDPAQNNPISGIHLDGYVPPAIDPEEPPLPPVTAKRKNKKMLVFSTIDANPATAGSLWALAGTSPGTDANWIETRDSVRAQAFMDACQVDSPVGLTEAEFAEYRDLYRSPVGTMEIAPAPEGV